MARVWEFTVKHRANLGVNNALDLFSTFSNHYGHAGHVYATYLVNNKEQVKDLLMRVRKGLNVEMQITQSERYWSALNAAILTSLAICRKLGLLQFSPVAMKKWIKEQLENNRSQLNQNIANPIEQFGDMLRELSPSIIATIGEGTSVKSQWAKIENHVYGPPVGRMIYDGGNSKEVLYVSAEAAKEWCAKHGVSSREMHAELVARGIADPHVRRVRLGKGTIQYHQSGGQTKVWEIDPPKLRAILGDVDLATPKVALIGGNGNANANAGSGQLTNAGSSSNTP
jgi:hypothetical protein